MLSKKQRAMMGTYETLLLAFDMDNIVDEARSLCNMVNDSMRLWEAHITWLQRFLKVIMAQRLVSKVLELLSIFYFMVCHHSGQRDPWPKLSDNAKDFVKKMFNPDPKQHLTVQECLKAPNVPLGETVKARLKQLSIMNKLKKRALRVQHPRIQDLMMTDIRNMQAFALYIQKNDIKFDLFSIAKEMEKHVSVFTLMFLEKHIYPSHHSTLNLDHINILF
ncbi:hypothetical protein CXB51_005804 [Gossypium anomalum]|uniref:Uncharacterized protein n=1 Tax=Gossypium anomalum TaxID=47600 RepID=A0A8J5ZI93_9ROSI|nr:hypothetical protein CXB51_005804 [Gossypium anomalum]